MSTLWNDIPIKILSWILFRELSSFRRHKLIEMICPRIIERKPIQQLDCDMKMNCSKSPSWMLLLFKLCQRFRCPSLSSKPENPVFGRSQLTWCEHIAKSGGKCICLGNRICDSVLAILAYSLFAHSIFPLSAVCRRYIMVRLNSFWIT